MSSRRFDLVPADEAKRTLKRTSAFALFWLLSTSVCLLEALLIALKPSEDVFIIELILLAVSTLLFGLGLLGTIFCLPERAFNSGDYLDIFDTEVALEFFFLFIGWATFFTHPNVAALRCLRLYRYACNYEVFPPEARKQQYNSIEYFFWSVERIAESLHVKKWAIHWAVSIYVTYIMGVVFEFRNLGSIEAPDPQAIVMRVLEFEGVIKASWLYQSISDRALVFLLGIVAVLMFVAFWELSYYIIHESPHSDVTPTAAPVTSTATSTMIDARADGVIAETWKDTGYESGSDTPRSPPGKTIAGQKVVIESLKAELKKHSELLQEHAEVLRRLAATEGLKVALH
jgi:hypothetical protein